MLAPVPMLQSGPLFAVENAGLEPVTRLQIRIPDSPKGEHDVRSEDLSRPTCNRCLGAYR